MCLPSRKHIGDEDMHDVSKSVVAQGRRVCDCIRMRMHAQILKHQRTSNFCGNMIATSSLSKSFSCRYLIGAVALAVLVLLALASSAWGLPLLQDSTGPGGGGRQPHWQPPSGAAQDEPMRSPLQRWEHHVLCTSNGRVNTTLEYIIEN